MTTCTRRIDFEGYTWPSTLWGDRWGSKWDVSGWITWLACQGPWQRKTGRSPCLACLATTKPFEKSVRHSCLGSSMSGGLTEEKENLGDCRTCSFTVRGTDTCHSSAIHTTLGPAPRACLQSFQASISFNLILTPHVKQNSTKKQTRWVISSSKGDGIRDQQGPSGPKMPWQRSQGWE